MPNTPTHDWACVIVSTGIVTVAIATQQADILFVAAGGISGLLFSPDWDWDGYNSYGKWISGKVARRWKYLPPLYWLICLYAWVVPHRSWISHQFIYPTIIRVMWLLFPIGLFFFYPRVMSFWLLGLIIADTTHFLLDIIVTKFRRTF